MLTHKTPLYLFLFENLNYWPISRSHPHLHPPQGSYIIWCSECSDDNAPCLHTHKPEPAILQNPVSIWFGGIIKNIFVTWFYNGWQSIREK